MREICGRHELDPDKLERAVLGSNVVFRCGEAVSKDAAAMERHWQEGIVPDTRDNVAACRRSDVTCLMPIENGLEMDAKGALRRDASGDKPS